MNVDELLAENEALRITNKQRFDVIAMLNNQIVELKKLHNDSSQLAKMAIAKSISALDQREEAYKEVNKLRIEVKYWRRQSDE